MSPSRKNMIMTVNAGNSIKSQPHLAGRENPQPFLEWRPYGADIRNRDANIIAAKIKIEINRILYIIISLSMNEIIRYFLAICYRFIYVIILNKAIRIIDFLFFILYYRF